MKEKQCCQKLKIWTEQKKKKKVLLNASNTAGTWNLGKVKGDAGNYNVTTMCTNVAIEEKLLLPTFTLYISLFVSGGIALTTGRKGLWENVERKSP